MDFPNIYTPLNTMVNHPQPPNKGKLFKTPPSGYIQKSNFIFFNADQLIFLPQPEKILIRPPIYLISTKCSVIIQLGKSPVAAKILSGGYYGD